MSQLSGNSCSVITVLPLGLNCSSVNASTPQSTNGSITLFITGGTPPYNISWNNGAKGSFLTNLLAGDYTATVVDYYGDFTAKTTCTVGFKSFYLEEFKNCKNSNKVYYLAELPSIFEKGKIYELTTQSGCWISSGITLYNTQTYINSFAKIESGPYVLCDVCDPPIPPVVYPPKLCITYGDGNTYTPIEINSGNTINGYPSWTASPSNEIVYYNTGNTRWEISGWTKGGVPIFNNPKIPPVGTWTILGTFGKTFVINQGVCPPPPLKMKLSNNGPTCSNTSNGTIVVTGMGGTPPYLFSLNGLNYQSGNIYTNLLASTYTVYVKDANNSIISQSTTLSPQEILQNHTLNIVTLSQNIVTNTDTQTKTYTFKIEVIPPLPSNKTLSFVLPVNVLITGNTTTFTPPTSTIQTSLLTFTNNGTATMTGPTNTTPSINSTTPKELPCINTNITTSAYTQNYQGTITGNASITGTLVQVLTIPTVIKQRNECGLNSGIRNVLTITNQTLTPSNCTNLNSAISPLVYEFDKTGLVFESLKLCMAYESEMTGEVLCEHTASGILNNKPYFELKDKDCNNIPNIILFWSINSRWEVRDNFGNGTLFTYNNNPGQYPIRTSVYPWVAVENFEFLDSTTDMSACQYESYQSLYLKYAEAVGLTQSATVPS